MFIAQNLEEANAKTEKSALLFFNTPLGMSIAFKMDIATKQLAKENGMAV